MTKEEHGSAKFANQTQDHLSNETFHKKSLMDEFELIDYNGTLKPANLSKSGKEKLQLRKDLIFEKEGNQKEKSGSQEKQEKPMHEDGEESTCKQEERILQQGDWVCPESEPFVGYIHGGGANKETRLLDIEIRPKDRMQFYTGIYYPDINTATEKKCMLAKLSRKGDYEASAYLATNWYGTYGQISECYSLVLNELDQIIAVGKATINTRTAALIVWTDEYFSQSIIKVWSNTAANYGAGPSSVATDVAVTNDGGIFVTGYLSGYYIQGVQDCFILRLNHTLDRVFIKSFGIASNYLECHSIQVTRNYDYIYVGGNMYAAANGTTSLIFMKMDHFADTIIATYLTPTAGNEQYFMRRIIMEHNKAFSGTDDNNKLYFCGYTPATQQGRNGEMLFGVLTSNALTSASFVITAAFQYGSPGSETMGDCALTSDNNYFFGVFSTNQYESRRAKYGITAGSPPIDTDYNYGQLNADINDPNNNGCGAWSIWNFITDATKNAVANWFRTQAYNQIYQFTDDYNSYTYSWKTCNFYVYNYNALNAYITSFYFPDCDYLLYDTQSLVNWFWVWCGAMWVHTNDCQAYWPSIRDNKIWYAVSNRGVACRNDQFKEDVWEWLMDSAGEVAVVQPYTFCMTHGGYEAIFGAGSLTNNFCSWDWFQMPFEQDCSDDGGSYYNWYIFKVAASKLSLTTVANRDSIPDNAAYFGDAAGHSRIYTVAVDDYGYVYLSGTTTATNFGANAWESPWLFAKTHFELHYEIKESVASSGYNIYNANAFFLGKRFVQPKKFKNSDNPLDPPTLTTYSFTVMIYPNAAYTLTPTPLAITSYPINENINTMPSGAGGAYHYFTASLWAAGGYSNYFFGDSYSRMAEAFPVDLVYSASNYKNSINLPNVCKQYSSNPSNPAIDYYRSLYYNKQYYQGAQTIDGMSITTTTDQTSNIPYTGYLTGAVAEGIYYINVEADAWAYVYNGNGVFTWGYGCPYAYTAYFFDDYTHASLRRYLISQRMKLLIDRQDVNPPSVLTNIPDIQPTIGQRYLYRFMNNYFTNPPGCTYYKAKQSRNTTTPTTPTTQLPYWMIFHEQNASFTMYPVFTGKVFIELYCCNAIDQCAINTFTVDPVDTSPATYIDVNPFASPYVIQYDAYEGVGQYFYWGANAEWFYDADQGHTDVTDLNTYMDYTNDDIYLHTKHTVWVTMQQPAVNGFQAVYWMGLIFGKAYYISGANNNIGTKIINFKYQDQYTLSAMQYGQFDVIINRQPSPTATGLSYAFSDLNPIDNVPTTYFDKIFPFIKDDFANILEVSTSTWFTDADGDTLTYECTYSDYTDRPNWIGYDTSSGLLRGYPGVNDSSEYMNLRFTAYDTKEGYYSYVKTLLVDTPPKARSLYEVVEIGVDQNFAYYVGDLIDDPDSNDYLNYYLPNSKDIAELKSYGLEFSSPKNMIAGTTLHTGVIGFITIRAEDPHGYYATIYLTIKIKEYPVKYRTNVVQYPDIVVTEGQNFSFALNNVVFYDPTDGTPIVVFATDENDEALPAWMHFTPTTKVFYGTAPEPQTFKIRVIAMNQQSQKTTAVEFRFTIVPNNNPKTNVLALSQDYRIYVQNWFEHTSSIQVFTDPEFNTNPELEVKGSSGLPIPGWLTFNYQNRTLYGWANETGKWRIDFIYTDDYGKKTYQNILIVVLPREILNRKLLTWNYTLMASVVCGFIIYILWLNHSSILVAYGHKEINLKEKGIASVAKRFEGFKDVEIKYNLPVYERSIAFGLDRSAVTHDFEFIQQERDGLNQIALVTNTRTKEV